MNNNTGNRLTDLPKFYVINMKRSVDRLTYINNLFNKYGIKYQIVEAIDGKNDDVDKYCAIKHTRGNHIKLENGVYNDAILATIISHLKAIETFANDVTNTDDYAIIVEDDIAFDFCDYWDISFNDIIRTAPSDWEIIQLVYGRGNSKDKKYNARFSFVKGYGFSATAYLIKKDKAREYVNRYFKNSILQNNIGIDHARYIADYFIYDHANTYTYIPSLFTYRDDNDSYIHPNHLSKHIQLKNENKQMWKNRKQRENFETMQYETCDFAYLFIIFIIMILIGYIITHEFNSVLI